MKRSVPFLLALVLGLAGLVGLSSLAGLTGVAAAATTPLPENLPRALGEQRRLVALQPGNAAARNDLGNLLMLVGDVDGAEDAYRAAVELAPERSGYRYNLALLLHEAGRSKDAAKLYREVLEIDPANAWAHYQLGAILEAQGHESRAVERYARALQLDPSLAFPDVNPLVIESDLVTEAMLMGYAQGLVTSRAPRVYNDPNRIARLLIVDGDPLVEPEEETPPGMLAEEEPEGVMTGMEPDDPMSAEERRVLDSGDLSDRPVNQAQPQGRAGYRPPAGNSGRGDSNVRRWRPPTQPAEAEGNEAAERRDRNTRRGGVVVGNAPGGAAQEADDEPRVGSPADPRRRLDGEFPGSDRGPNPANSTGSLRMTLDDGNGNRAG